MTTTETETSSKSKRSGASWRASVENARPSPKTKSNPLKAKMPETANAQNEVRVTKHDRVLTLLTAEWRQHRRHDAGNELATAQRAWLPSRHCQKEARLHADLDEA